jgi:N-methylhydantoinase A
MLGSYANPVHEELICAKIHELWPEVSLICSSMITREHREYERTNTTTISASIKPIVKEYLTKLK